MATTVCADGNQFELDDTGKLQIKTGCGIEFDENGSGLQIADALEWPFDCDMEDFGGRIYCDPATGAVRTAPPDRFGSFSHTADNDSQRVLGPGQEESATATVTIDLSSGHCFDVIAMCTNRALWAVETTATGTQWEVRADLVVDGVQNQSLLTYRESAGVVRRVLERRVGFQVPVLLAAGAVHTLTSTVTVRNSDNAGSLNFDIANSALTGFYHTNRP